MANPRLWAVITLAGLLIALLAVAIILIPFGLAPAPAEDQRAVLRDLPVDMVSKGRALAAALRPSRYASLLLGLLVPLLLGLTPAGAAIVEWCGRPFGGNWLARALLGGLLIVLIGSVVSLPFAAWRQSVLRRYGLSTQGWAGWGTDLVKGYAIGAVIGALALAGFYTITRYAPRWWWAYAAGAAAALVVLFSFVFPVLIEPVFNKFTPMPEGPLRTELIELAAGDGLPVRDVLVADASRRTSALNAYVSGFGATRRVVVYDTLLRAAPPEEVVSVVAHELGHARDNDVVAGTAIGALGTAASVVALYLLGAWTGLLRLAGVNSIGEPRAIALVLAVVAIAGLVTGPAQSLVSRRVEARADRHALVLTGDAAGFAAMQQRLAATNIADVRPPRVEHLLFASHPDTVERIAAARVWQREHPR